MQSYEKKESEATNSYAKSLQKSGTYPEIIPFVHDTWYQLPFCERKLYTDCIP